MPAPMTWAISRPRSSTFWMMTSDDERLANSGVNELLIASPGRVRRAAYLGVHDAMTGRVPCPEHARYPARFESMCGIAGTYQQVDGDTLIV